ncbi:MAG: ATP-dependent helicase [Acidimicrobiaceae bacterium]|nr:ATP-dependent helicase [Acidimicrobiaceae bacterium]
MVDLSSLNANQLESVQWSKGPLLVLAGPGSGKTRVLTYRVARMVEESPGKHFRILGLTFTHRAASEMRTRIEGLVSDSRDRILLTTFHSFCANLLRQHGHHIGLRPDFTILAQTIDRQAVLDEAIEETRKDHSEVSYRGEQLLPAVNRLLDNCVSTDTALQELNNRNVDKAEVLAAIYANYLRLMIENNQLDFGCLIAETLGLLERNPNVRRLIHRIYPYVCVDEFQDTNLAQYRILTNLVNPSTKNLFVVADDDQIIYQWNGADPKRLQALHTDFGVTVLQLPENYRCPPKVVEAANNLINHNLTRGFDKAAPIAHKPEGDAKDVIRVENFGCFQDEADWIANDIGSNRTTEQSDCVVLARTRKLLKPVVDALQARGIDAYIALRKGEFLSNQMVWLHSVLRLANTRQDREQLRRVCKSFFDLADMNLQVPDIISDAATTDGDYLRAWRRSVLNKTQLDARTRTFLKESIPVLSEKLDFRTFIQAAFDWFDELEPPDVEPDMTPRSNGNESEFSEEKNTWHDLVAEVESELGGDQVTLNALLQGLDLRCKTPLPSKDAIPCHTIHAAKGTEFNHVYLVGLVEDQLPSYWAVKKGPDSHEIQEERRNCFVAITRVQNSLTLTYSNEVFGWHKSPSRFLQEMGLVA